MKPFILAQLRADGFFYFLFNYKSCIQHCRNQKRLHDESQDPVRQAAIARYADALIQAGDLR